MFGKKKAADIESASTSGSGSVSNTGIQGYAYITLQVIRFCNIAVLVAVMAASVLMLIYAKLPNGYQFFADVIHGLVVFCAGVLIFTEIGAWSKGQEMIAGAWPMLGPDRGFSGIGAIMIFLGCHLLGGLSTKTYTEDGVPTQISQVIIGSGIIALAFGVTNIFASLIFRNNEVRAREIRQAGATTRDYTFNDNISSRSHSARKAGISGPMPINDQGIEHPVGYYGDDKTAPSFDTRHSPIAPEISRPSTALHPMHHRSSHYSEASNLARFDNNMF